MSDRERATLGTLVAIGTILWTVLLIGFGIQQVSETPDPAPTSTQLETL